MTAPAHLSDDDLDPHLPQSIYGAKRCGMQRSVWLPGWFIPWSPRNDNANAEGPWSDWVALAHRIIAVDERAHAAAGRLGPAAPFQQAVQPWMLACFGEAISGDREERNHRFLEEALELVQACGCTASEAHQLVDYVYGRAVGEPAQEVGGVMVTLAALCLANGLDMHAAGWTELNRIWGKVEQIRAKQAAKPKHSPLPEAAAPAETIGNKPV